MVLLCSSLMILQSCATRQGGTVAETFSKGDVRGTWVVNDITFEGILPGNVQSLFGEGSYKCFIGSTWNLPNSGNGTYALPGGEGCTAGTQSIVWSVNKTNQTFQFKKLYEGDKAKNVTDGYVLVLSSATDNNLVLKSPVQLGSSTAYVVLNLSKAVK